jgi:hypothetical protein
MKNKSLVILMVVAVLSVAGLVIYWVTSASPQVEGVKTAQETLPGKVDENGLEMMDGCQGEGCGCTNDEYSREAFTLYEKRSLTSKKVGEFPAKTKASVGKIVSLLTKPGKYLVTKVMPFDPSAPVTGSRLPLNVGDELTHLFYEGEGLTMARRRGDWIVFDSAEADLKTVAETEYEVWIEINVGNLSGYSPTFPFMNCLE